MNNNYLSGNDLYPESVVSALTYLSHFSDGENKKGSTGISFAQYADTGHVTGVVRNLQQLAIQYGQRILSHWYTAKCWGPLFRFDGFW